MKLHTDFEKCDAELNVSSSLHFEEHAEHLDSIPNSSIFFKVLICVYKRVNFVDSNGNIIVQNMLDFLREDNNVTEMKTFIEKCLPHSGSPEEKMRFFYTCASKQRADVLKFEVKH